MKAVQIENYSESIKTVLSNIPIPQIGDTEILIKVKAAAVNPLELLILTGKIKLIQDYPMPLTLGNECSGIIEEVGKKVVGFQKGDRVYGLLPLEKIGAFAEYVKVDQKVISKMPMGYDFTTAVAIPLSGLTAYQGIIEELRAKAGETLFIAGGSGSFGEMAVPLAKKFGLRVIISGNERSKDRFLAMGVDQYINYKNENYWEVLSDVDYIIDTLGDREFEHELSVLKRGGTLLSLKTAPNKEFAIKREFSFLKRLLFTIAGKKYDKLAQRQGKKYRFMFVQANGVQLKKITQIVEENHIKPTIDSRIFSIEQVNEALRLVSEGNINGKVIIQM